MTAVALAGALILAAPPTASAAMAVFDGTLVGKAIEQLKEAKEQLAVQLEQLSKLKEQLSFLSDMTKFINSVSDAIGEIATIELPIPNILQASSQIKADLRCLTPDGPGWGIKFSDLNLSSICETSSKYRDALFVNQKDLEGQPFSKSEAAWAKVGQRRDALLEDTAVRGLAREISRSSRQTSSTKLPTTCRPSSRRRRPCRSARTSSRRSSSCRSRRRSARTR